MGLQDALRKAAGLLIELPPENSGGDNEAHLSPDATSPERVDVDALLAEQGLGPRARGDAPSGSNTPTPGGSPNKSGPPPSTRNTAQGTPQPGKTGETKTVEQIVRDAAGPNLEDIKVDVSKAGAGPINAAAIYGAAKLPPAPFAAEQMLDMLASLPAELPLDTRRQTVKVTLAALGKTMGATPETIVADASRKIAALAAYVEHLSKRTDEFVADGERDIAALQAQIEEKRGAIANARQELTRASQMCNAESDRLDDVLEFFSLDVPPSKYAAPAQPASVPQSSGPRVAPPQNLQK
ncbi:MAG TPA: hypothetical protein VF600_10950 [Abditibacteriaceae bacterium]|jgi:hypothetical protein